MAVKEIPRSFEYTCDVCGATDLQENAAGHYADSRPPRWSRLKLARTAYDQRGLTCGDASIERLLCEACSGAIYRAINAASEKIRDGAQ